MGAFLRISLAVWFLGLTKLKLAWSAYFDDYTVFSSRQLARNTEQAIHGLFDLLGLDFARKGKKATPFSKCFRSLGVEINLDGFQSAKIKIRHTEDRRAELNEHLGQFLSSGYISSKQAESLRGRLHWFECFAFGRIANKAISRLAEFSVKENRKNNLDKEDVKLFRYLQSRVCAGDPLMLTPASSETWIIFTDGACEGLDSKQGTVGGVLYAPSGFAFSCFGEVVPDSVMDQLLQFSRNPIFELELLPILVALLLWKEHLAHAQTVFYLENDGARYCLIKARADTHWGENIIHAFLKLELTLQLKVWFGRVPTSANIADGPSRLDFGLLAKGFPKVSVCSSEVWDLVCQSVSNGEATGLTC